MRRSERLACVLAVVALAGCERDDPYVREGLWRPIGANDTNLRAMVANPGDLNEGRGSDVSSGDLAAAAVARLRADAVKPLPDSSISSVQVSGSGAGPTAPSGGSNAADPVSPAAAASAPSGGGS